MVQRGATTKAASLYRLNTVADLSDAFDQEHFARRDSEQVSLDGLPALLLHGELGSSRPSWLADIDRLVGFRPTLQSGSAGACLVWQESDGEHWALTWGSGFHFLKAEVIQHHFPPRVLVRTAETASIKSLTKAVLDYRSRVDRSTVPGGDSIAALGVEGIGEVVSRIESRVLIPELTHGARAFTLRAGEALYAPLATDAATLRKDVKVLQAAEKLPVRRGLEAIEQLKALRPTDDRVADLDRRLLDALRQKDISAVAVSWPQDRLRIDGAPDWTKVWIPGTVPLKVNGSLDTDVLFGQLEVWKADGYSVEDILQRARVGLFDDEPCKPANAVSREVPLRQWLMYEASVASQRFCFHDARWYQMDQDYLKRIDDLVAEVFAVPPRVALAPWGLDIPNEDAYNKRLATDLDGVVMDKKLIHTDLHRRGIEVCDVYVPDVALVHVKRADSSSSLSHLMAQGLVSADSLRRDDQARALFLERAKALSGGRVDRADWKQVIFGMARPRPIDSTTLFSFSKVNLVRQVQYLRSFGVDVAVSHILRQDSTGAP